MISASRSTAFPSTVKNKRAVSDKRHASVRHFRVAARWAAVCNLLAGVSLIAMLAAGCGETAKPVVAPATGQVNTYFGGPFEGVGVQQSTSSFDHLTNKLNISSAIGSATVQPYITGTFAAADTGFLSITENFANGTPQNPAVTGAWAVEIPGAGAMANLLSQTTAGSSATSPAPIIMTESANCPNFSQQTPFLYVNVPKATAGSVDEANFGGVDITIQGSDVTFTTHPWLVGPTQQTAYTSTGACSNTELGAITAFPINSFAFQSTYELIGIGSEGLLVSSYNQLNGSTPGVFGNSTGAVGVHELPSPIDVSSVISASYNGFFYAPQYGNTQFTMLASSYGNNQSTSPACSALVGSIAANNGQGAETISALPSANSLYGGEFLTTTATGSVNDPTGAAGSENCDVVIDLGQEGLANGLFPAATIFVGSNFPPNSTANPWVCSGSTTCAVSFPAVAVVGKVAGQYVIFVTASANSTPAAQLPAAANVGGSFQAQPLGIYLFQKM